MQDEVILLPRTHCNWFKSLCYHLTVPQGLGGTDAFSVILVLFLFYLILSVLIFYIWWLSRASCLSWLYKHSQFEFCVAMKTSTLHTYIAEVSRGRKCASLSLLDQPHAFPIFTLSQFLEINEVLAHANVSARSWDAFLLYTSPRQASTRHRTSLHQCKWGLTGQLANKTKQVGAEMLHGSRGQKLGVCGVTESGHP